jgi:hypothetical protein
MSYKQCFIYVCQTALGPPESCCIVIFTTDPIAVTPMSVMETMTNHTLTLETFTVLSLHHSFYTSCILQVIKISQVLRFKQALIL